MYEITSADLNKSTQSYIDPGISSGIEITEVKGEASPSGNAFFSYRYENEQGQYIVRTEWEVRELPPMSEWSPKMLAMMEEYIKNKKGKNGLPLTIEEAPEHYVNAKRKAQVRRILEVATQFVDESELTGQTFESYLDFVKFVKEKIGANYEGVKLRVKFTFDSRGYVNTPDYVRNNTPWIEREDKVPADKSKIIIVPGLDRLVSTPRGSRPNQSEKNPLEDTTSKEVKTPVDEDAPF